MPVDYSKWDHIDVSDDDDDPGHPNIDRASLMRWKKRSREEKRAQAQQEHALWLEKRESNLARIAELKSLIDSNDLPKESKSNLQKELEKCEKFEQDGKKQEELEKAHPHWTSDSICHDGFSKTIINKPASLPNSSSSKVKVPTALSGILSDHAVTNESDTPATSSHDETIVQPIITSDEQETAKSSDKHPIHAPKSIADIAAKASDDEQKEIDAYVEAMEHLAHELNSIDDYEHQYKFLTQHPEIVCEETESYLLLYCSDAIKRGEFEESKRYLRTKQIVECCRQLGKNGISLFYDRMRHPSGRFRTLFEDDLVVYWGKIKAKVEEMQREKAARRARGEPDSDEEEIVEMVEVKDPSTVQVE